MFSSLYVPKEPIGKYMPFLALFQLYVIFGEPYLGLTYFQWIRDLLGPKIMILTVQILVYAHSIEAYIALMYSTSRKLPFSITFRWFLSTLMFGGPTLFMLISKKHPDSVPRTHEE